MAEQGTLAAPIEVTDATFKHEVLESDVPVVVDFWAPWCPPCRAIAPIMSELAQEYAGRIKITKLNTDEDQQHASQLGIRGIPTLIIFKGGVEVGRIVGAQRKAGYQQTFDSLLQG